MAEVVTPSFCATADTIAINLVSSCSIRSVICTSRSARLSAAADMRFWVMSTKVARKIASSEAVVAKNVNEESK